MNETIITKNVFSKNISKKLEWDINVPDSKKDVLKILSVKIDCLMEDYSFSQGAFSAKIIAMAEVLYIPDDNEENDCICTLHTQENFVVKADVPVDISWDIEDVRLKNLSDNCVMLNSRKLGLSSDSVVCIELYQDVELPDFKDNENSVFDLKNANASYICAVANEKISFSSQFTLPSGKSGIEEILCCDTKLKNCELKSITNKAVLKGDICVCMLYLSENGNLENVEFSSPFTEIADVMGMTDDMDVIFEACVRKSDVSCDNNGITVEGVIVLDLKAFMNEKMQYVCDAYSPDYEEKITKEKLSCIKMSRCFTDSHNMKEILSFDDFEILEIYFAQAKANVLNAQIQGNRVLINANLLCSVTYKTPSGIRCDKKTLPFEFLQDIQTSDCYDNVEITSDVENFSYVIAGHNCVEIRCNVIFNTHLSSCEELSYINSMEIDKTKKKQLNRAPVVAYFPKSDERVFDISKKYCSTPDKIRFINSLGNSDICPKDVCIIIE